jgi:hypothetical protein
MGIISYATATISNFIGLSTKCLHGVWSHHPKYYGGRSSVLVGRPTQLGHIHQIYASPLLATYSKSLENPTESGNCEYSHNEKNEGIQSGTLVAYPCQAIQCVEKCQLGCY